MRGRRAASRKDFPQTVTVISLTKADDRVRQAIAEHKTTIDGIRGLPNFLDVLRVVPQTKEAFKDFSDGEIKQALAKDSSESSSPDINPRVAEFDLLASGAPLIGSDTAGSFLYAETLSRDGLALQEPWAGFLRNVVKVHKLREVTCLYGFTRLEPPPTLLKASWTKFSLP
jgi:hypothetical protein